MAPDETLREALAEALNLKFHELCHVGAMAGKRVPDFWLQMADAARRALATPTKPEMQSVHPAQPSGKEENEAVEWARTLVACWPGHDAPTYAHANYAYEAFSIARQIVAAHKAPAERDSEGPSLLPGDPGQDEQGKGESQ